MNPFQPKPQPFYQQQPTGSTLLPPKPVKSLMAQALAEDAGRPARSGYDAIGQFMSSIAAGQINKQYEKQTQDRRSAVAAFLEGEGGKPRSIEDVERQAIISGDDNLMEIAKMRRAAAAKAEPPSAVQEYEYAKNQGYPGSYLDFQLAQKKAGGTNVNINNAPAKGETKYQEVIGTQLGERWGKLAEEGDTAAEGLAIVGQLRNIMPEGGTMTGIAGKLAEWGIGGEGMSDIQATQALVDRLTPKQRVPGSGTSSDLDVKMFKSGMPSLWRTPEGNAIILDTMEALELYKRARGDIAYQIMDGSMTRQDAVKAFKALPDPFAEFKAYRGRTAAGQTSKAVTGGKSDMGAPPVGVDANVWKYMMPEERALWK